MALTFYWHQNQMTALGPSVIVASTACYLQYLFYIFYVFGGN